MEDLPRWKTTWAEDIKQMNLFFGVHTWMTQANRLQKQELLKLRMRMLLEEHTETMNAYLEGDAEEMVDGMIDLCVIAIGTLDIMGVDAQRAWNAVFEANMSKSVGVKIGRNNPLDLPDLTKPDDWEAPNHQVNIGQLGAIL